MRRAASSLRKHPRIRGENLELVDVCEEFLETSPHTRGEPGCDGLTDVEGRNIPAYAGRTRHPAKGGGRRRKHPRIRGENSQNDRIENNGGETSPHTRGEPRQLEWKHPF